MQLSNIFIAVAALGTVSADRMTVSSQCFHRCSWRTLWINDNGKTYEMARLGGPGCVGTTAVPGMTELCIDKAKGRAHFKFSHQSNKRCMVRTGGEYDSDCGLVSCENEFYVETACTWREPMDPNEPMESVSATKVETPASTEVIEKEQ
jgi:hypothetical protein